MAETTGLVVGAIGLAGLFSACTECFELIQRGRSFGRDYQLLETKFANQRIRLVALGRACRLDDPDGYEWRLMQDEDVKRRLEVTLSQLVCLLKDGDALRQRYGLPDEDQSVVLASTSSSPRAFTGRSARFNLGQSLAQLGHKVNLTQRKATIGKKFRWAIEHRGTFDGLVQDVRNLVDDFESLVVGMGLQKRLRQMVQMEVDAIRDVQTLELIAEARVGRLDSISDIASLRLFYIRGQLGLMGDRFSSPSVVSPSPPQRDTPSPPVQEDWEFVVGMPPISSTGETRFHFLELHRVHCDMSPTAIFLEEPNYDTRRNDWVVIDERCPPKEPRSLHLCGQTPIADWEFSLAQNTQLGFVVFHDYRCTHNAISDEPLDCKPHGQSVRVISADLFSALQELPAIAGLHPALQLNAEAHFPYYWFYHVRGSLDSQIQAQPESKASALGNFLEFLRQSTDLEYAKVDGQLSRGVISWKYIRYLFRVGGVVVERHPEGTEHYQAYRIEDEPHISDVSSGLQLNVYRIEKRLSDLKVRTTLTLQRGKSSNAEAEIQLSGLDVVPLQFAGEIDENCLVSRGKQLLNCFPRRLVSYAGPIVEYVDDTPGGRWMVDPPLYEQLCGINMGGHAYERVRLSPADWEQDAVLLQPTVHGFNLKTHTWDKLLVVNTHEVTWDKKRFGRLILDRVDREFLHNNVTSSVLRASDGAPFSLSLLFHGNPGAGKAFAAQAVGDLIERPLYHITPRDMGSTAKDLAQSVSTAMHLATIWNCVIFLRDVGNLLSTESSLAEFTRLYENFKGIIILTFSNRGTPLAEILSSRIQINIHLPPLSEQQSRMLWENGLRQLQQAGFNVDQRLFRGTIVKFFERGLSCRDIQNALANVERLATFSPQEIDKKMVERVLSYKWS